VGLVACGSSGATESSEAAHTNAGAAQGMPAAQGPTGAAEPGGTAAQPTETALSQCSVGRILGIAHALIRADIDRAQFALTRTQDSLVKEYAKRTLKQDKKIDEQLTSFETEAGVKALDGDLSNMIRRSARDDLRELQAAGNFDREYLGTEIASAIKAVGFVHLVREIAHGAGGQTAPGTEGTPGEQAPATGQGMTGPIGLMGGAQGAQGAQGFASPTGYAVPAQFAYPTAGAPGAIGGQAANQAAPTGAQDEKEAAREQKLEGIVHHAAKTVKANMEQAIQIQTRLVGACGVPAGTCEETDTAADPLTAEPAGANSEH
jgi:predicted outer membrane protein